VLFDSVVSGSGALNRHGVGVAQLYRSNSFSGGVNILEGTVQIYTNGTALGTGAVAIGGVGSSTNATLRVGTAITITNAVTVNSGSGVRTIANDSARGQPPGGHGLRSAGWFDDPAPSSGHRGDQALCQPAHRGVARRRFCSGCPCSVSRRRRPGRAIGTASCSSAPPAPRRLIGSQDNADFSANVAILLAGTCGILAGSSAPWL
jgi:hypothetical protein